MATPKSTRHRFALGPGNVNIFASCLIPAKHYDSDGGDKIVRKDHNTLPRKRSIDCSDDVQKSKVARYFGVPDKRVGIEHWLEDGVVSGSPSCLREGDTRAFCQTGIHEVEQLVAGSRESLSSLGVPNVEGIGSRGFGAPAFSQERMQSSQLFNNTDPSATSFSTSAAAATLRLRLRVALFKVQTNQTAIPISHLQLPESSPQPLSVFPPSLVRISTPNVDHDGCYKDFSPGIEEIGSVASPPPSSPPPLARTTTRYTGRGIPFLAPVKLSSPSPNHGKPLDFGSSSDSRGGSSRDCSPSANLIGRGEKHNF